MAFNTKCILCGTGKQRFICKNSFFGEKHDVVECENCGLVFVRPQPTEDELMEYYARDYHGVINSHDKTRHTKDYKFQTSALNQSKFLKKFLGASTQRKSLEVGGGKGFLSKTLLDAGFECWLVEPDAESAETARGFGLNVINTIYSRAKLPKNYFGVALMSHSLEHMTDPKSALIDLRRRLTPDGLLFIEVPNELNKNIKETHGRSVHTYYFTPKTLKKLLESAGFGVVSQSVYSPRFPQRLSMLFKRSRKPNPGAFGVCEKTRPTLIHSLYHPVDKIYFKLFGGGEKTYGEKQYSGGENIRVIAKKNQQNP